MKKILSIILGIILSLGLISFTYAMVFYNTSLTENNRNQELNIKSGETIVFSLSRKIDSIDFNKDSGFTIRTLEGGKWIDMSDNVSDYVPMKGYMIRNVSQGNLIIDMHLATITNANDTIFQKTLKAGWNLVGPAYKNDDQKMVDVLDALGNSNYSHIADFTGDSFIKVSNISGESKVYKKLTYSGEVTIGANTAIEHRINGNNRLQIKNKNELQGVKILEGLAYAVFVSNDTTIPGSQKLISGESNISGEDNISGESNTSGESNISGEDNVSDESNVSGESNISGEDNVSGEIKISGESDISGETTILNDGNNEIACSSNNLFSDNSCNVCYKINKNNLGKTVINYKNITNSKQILYKQENDSIILNELSSSGSWTGKNFKYSTELNSLYDSNQEGYIYNPNLSTKLYINNNNLKFEKDSSIDDGEIIGLISADIITHNINDNQQVEIEENHNKICTMVNYKTPASLTLTKTLVNDRNVVLGDIQTVVYKAKISVGDSDDVTINTLTLSGSTTNSDITLNDVIESATINIGGQTFNGTVKPSKLEFNSINDVIPAGADDVEILVIAQLKKNDTLTGSADLTVELAQATDLNATDSSSSNVNLNIETGSVTINTLRSRGTLNISLEEDNNNEIKDFSLAGTNNIKFAKIKFDSKYEDANIKDLYLKIDGTKDFSNSLKNIKLVSETGATITNGASIGYTGNTSNGYTQIHFANDFTIKEVGNTNTFLVADLNSITDEGDLTTSITGAVQINIEENNIAQGLISSGALDITINNENLKTTKIVSNKVAGITLEKANNLASSGINSVLAKITVDMENQTSNKYDDGSEIIQALLKTVKLNISGPAASGATVKLSRAGITLTGSVDGENIDFDTSNLSTNDKRTFGTIDDGRAEFDVLVTYTSDNDTDYIKLKVNNIKNDIKLDDGSNSEIYLNNSNSIETTVER